MASIPLPALSVQPPQQPTDPLAGLQKLMALRSLGQQQQLQQQQIQSSQQEQQLRQQQIEDQKATTTAMKSWDGKDYNALAKSVLENGGSATAAAGIQQHGLTIQKTISDIAAQDAATGSKNLEAFQKRHEIVGNTLAEEKDIPDAQLHSWATQKLGELSQSGVLGPQEAQQAAQAIQSTPDPTALRQQIQTLAKVSLGAKAVADQAKTEAEAQSLTAIADQKRAESQWYNAHGGAPGVPVEAQQQAAWLDRPENKGKTPADYLVWKEHQSPTMFSQDTFGGKGDPMVDMVGQGRMDLATATARMAPAAKQQFTAALSQKYPGYNQSTFGIAQHAGEAFTSGPQGQQLTAIDTARQHMQTFKEMADHLANGNTVSANKVGQTFGMQFGSDKATNFQIARTAFAGEVGKAFAGANVGEGDRKELLDKINEASSPAQLKGFADTADKLLQGKQEALKRSFDAAKAGNPNFGGEGGAPPLSVKAPNGKTYTFKDQPSLDTFKKRAGIQ